jgi:hypothetical protein
MREGPCRTIRFWLPPPAMHLGRHTRRRPRIASEDSYFPRSLPDITVCWCARSRTARIRPTSMLSAGGLIPFACHRHFSSACDSSVDLQPEVFVKLLARFATVSVSAILVVGCGPRPPVIEPAPHGAVIRAAKTGLYSKNVMTKKEPDTLIADDGTICRVPAERYRDTALHSLVYCNWQ